MKAGTGNGENRNGHGKAESEDEPRRNPRLRDGIWLAALKLWRAEKQAGGEGGLRVGRGVPWVWVLEETCAEESQGVAAAVLDAHLAQAGRHRNHGREPGTPGLDPFLGTA